MDGEILLRQTISIYFSRSLVDRELSSSSSSSSPPQCAGSRVLDIVAGRSGKLAATAVAVGWIALRTVDPSFRHVVHAAR